VRTVLERLSNVERVVQADDGRWYLMRMLPYRTSDNRIDGIVITFQDITERRKAELLVRQSEERLRLLTDSALEYAIYTMTENGVIDYWSPGAERMFGYTSEEAVGSSASILLTPDDRARGAAASELQEAARLGRFVDERYMLRKDGTRIYCSGVTRRLGAGGVGFAKIARDLTAQRQTADALQKANNDLETRVGVRTRELEREARAHEAATATASSLLRRLVTSQEDERRRIARGLHDDLGQRLTALRLMIERHMQNSPETPNDGLDPALQMIAKIGGDLDFLSWQLRPSVLDELGLAAALPRFVTEWSAHVGIPAEFRLNGYERGHLSSDAELVLYRITQEALTNIAKHSRATRADVVLGVNNGEVVLVIEDDGVGFDVTETPANGGFGVLAMRERATLVDGTLLIESTPGRGTSVFLRRAIEPPRG
jgi:PAS domain S-box-containing protein